LIDEAVRLSGERTKAATVEAALREYVRLRRKELLLELPGRILLEESWRELREAELGE
jgi:Arc/MetJ family transcription regulator